MDILEPPEPDRVNGSSNSNMQHEEDNVVELEFLEGSLDVAMDEGDPMEDGDGQEVSLDANGAQQPLTYTLEEVLKMEVENPKAVFVFMKPEGIFNVSQEEAKEKGR
ncbi:hypothetical protein PIB30_038448 [Stylosanthes scabra]|uniref:Uncharacterized protein n=1 Tax=Stylosanthes scabra TaxID=79078 RepID=A0ABU6XC32_9FABA|nr:hypothetical protein [Stylosanthes scabra]